jgi:putative acetyltransferase
MSLVVRPERPGDEAAIFTVTRDAFVGAQHSSGTEQLIVDELRRRGVLTVSLVAERAGGAVGHVAISPVTIVPSEVAVDHHTVEVVDGWYGLGPVSVLPDHQGQGVGTVLIGQALRALADAQGCVVLGDPDYYGRFGFRPDPRLALPGVPPESFQVLRLAANEVPRGTVAYDLAFEAEAEG